MLMSATDTFSILHQVDMVRVICRPAAWNSKKSRSHAMKNVRLICSVGSGHSSEPVIVAISTNLF